MPKILFFFMDQKNTWTKFIPLPFKIVVESDTMGNVSSNLIKRLLWRNHVLVSRNLSYVLPILC